MTVTDIINSTEQSQQRISTYRKINIVLIIATLLVTITPYFERSIPTLYKASLIPFWYIDAFVLENKFLSFKFKRVFFILLIFTAWFFFLRIVGYSTAEWGNYYIFLAAIDLIIKSFYIINFYSSKEKNILFRAVQIIVLFSVVHNILINIVTPGAFVNYYYNQDAYEGTNMVSSQFFYNALAFFVMGAMVVVKSEKLLFYKILDVISIIFSVIFMLTVVPRLNAVLILLLFVFLSNFANDKKSAKKIILSLLFFVLLLFIFLLFDEFVEYAPERLRIRFLSIKYMIQGNQYLSVSESGSFYRRIEFQMLNLQTWISSFQTLLIGRGLHLGSQFYDVIGQHAFATDYLASYGCLGLSFVCYLFFNLRHAYLKSITSSIVRKYAAYMMLALIFSLFISDGFHPLVISESLLFFACIDTNNFEEIK